MRVAAARRGRRSRPRWASTAPFARATVRELVRAHAGVELAGDETADELRGKALRGGAVVGRAAAAGTPGTTSSSSSSSTASSRTSAAPARRSSSTGPRRWARSRAASPTTRALVERFELYAGGLELANAFGELTDPVEQRARFVEESAAARRAAARPSTRIDEKLLAALPRMPPTSGVALGFDRLVMLVARRRPTSATSSPSPTTR